MHETAWQYFVKDGGQFQTFPYISPVTLHIEPYRDKKKGLRRAAPFKEVCCFRIKPVP